MRDGVSTERDGVRTGTTSGTVRNSEDDFFLLRGTEEGKRRGGGERESERWSDKGQGDDVAFS